MSARHPRAKRWEQWNRRPGNRSMSSLPRRQRYTADQLDATADIAMKAGESMGRRWAERDLYEALAQDFVLREDATPQDFVELAAWVGGKALAGEASDPGLFTRLRRLDDDGDSDSEMLAALRAADPELVRRMADIFRDPTLTGEQVKEALEAFAREIGVFPEGVTTDDTPADDLLDVAEVAGVAADRAAEEAGWWSGPVTVGRPAPLVCPLWCTTDHDAPGDVRAGMRLHVRRVATVDRDGERVARVEIVSCDDLAGGEHGPAEIVVEARDAYGPDEAESIAAGLVEAARVFRGEVPADAAEELVAETERALRRIAEGPAGWTPGDGDQGEGRGA
ncbi:hypothetical protein AWW66_10910 [Micromonospora rosaria]|uniref:Uncharacterized protein n=1 Tax=Micromonospora rosaria TaxID=47874 RepID=A0A136PU53_9ACTN|nr:hypothetical protein [Micromonospora rosaria]KXK61943.1 hypothetical protein AWW66_10910 [Micromonospora rosaria]